MRHSTCHLVQLQPSGRHALTDNLRRLCQAVQLSLVVGELIVEIIAQRTPQSLVRRPRHRYSDVHRGVIADAHTRWPILVGLDVVDYMLRSTDAT